MTVQKKSQIIKIFMKTKLLITCLLLTTAQVFADNPYFSEDELAVDVDRIETYTDEEITRIYLPKIKEEIYNKKVRKDGEDINIFAELIVLAVLINSIAESMSSWSGHWESIWKERVLDELLEVY